MSKTSLIIQIALLCMGFFCFSPSFAQSGKLDSLEQIYSSQSFTPESELLILKELSRESRDPQKKLSYSLILKERVIELDSLAYLWDAIMQEGSAHRLKSDLIKALDTFIEASRIAQDLDSVRLVALSDITIGDVYSEMGDSKNSVSYYEKAIQVLRELNVQSVGLATALLNAGDHYYNTGDYDRAMTLFLESSLIFKNLDYLIGSAYNLGNIGMVYAKQGKSQLAEANIREALKILEEYEDFYAISIYLSSMADIYLEKNELSQALLYSAISLELAKKYELKDEISKSNLGLAGIYEKLDQPDKSLFYYKAYVQYRDSVNNVDNVQQLADLRTNFEISKKQIELDLINQERKNQRLISVVIAIILLIVSILSYGLFRRNKFINKTKTILEKERKKTDDLLCNILPEETAAELKEKGKVTAKKFRNATVLFSDFKGFTKFAEELPPEILVTTIDLYFSEFDRIMDKYNVEKIKTIGDAYMCASGLPVPDKKHAENMILAAKDMLAHVEKLKEVHAVNEPRFDIRIGIHSGPIVAGVVGERKFAYDIWGDTVNAAARMESTSEPGKINVSETTYQLVKDSFKFESRGFVEVKNRASIKMYFLADE